MNGPNDLWTRVTSARIVQVLVAYLAVSWGILQVADTLQQTLELESQPIVERAKQDIVRLRGDYSP